MAINGSGIRDTAQVLRLSPTTVIAILKKVAARHMGGKLVLQEIERKHLTLRTRLDR